VTLDDRAPVGPGSGLAARARGEEDGRRVLPEARRRVVQPVPTVVVRDVRGPQVAVPAGVLVGPRRTVGKTVPASRHVIRSVDVLMPTSRAVNSGRYVPSGRRTIVGSWANVLPATAPGAGTLGRRHAVLVATEVVVEHVHRDAEADPGMAGVALEPVVVVADAQVPAISPSRVDGSHRARTRLGESHLRKGASRCHRAYIDGPFTCQSHDESRS
jgi:hypothetical protein